MTVWCEEHKRSDCSHELTKLVDELAADNERLHDELTETQAVLNAAMEGRRWQLDRAMKAKADNDRLREAIRENTFHEQDEYTYTCLPGCWRCEIGID